VKRLFTYFAGEAALRLLVISLDFNLETYTNTNVETLHVTSLQDLNKSVEINQTMLRNINRLGTLTND
jgi:hypothetical protein